MFAEGTLGDGALRYAAAGRPLMEGEPSGDIFLVQAVKDQVLVILVDGLGHGNDAHEAAQVIVDGLIRSAELPLRDSVEKTHLEARNTRGGAVFIGRIRVVERVMECVSIGNVLFRACFSGKASVPATPGILGHSLRKIMVEKVEFSPGDWFVLASDGISTRFDMQDLAGRALADRPRVLLEKHAHEHDDATALVMEVPT